MLGKSQARARTFSSVPLKYIFVTSSQNYPNIDIKDFVLVQFCLIFLIFQISQIFIFLKIFNVLCRGLSEKIFDHDYSQPSSNFSISLQLKFHNQPFNTDVKQPNCGKTLNLSAFYMPPFTCLVQLKHQIRKFLTLVWGRKHLKSCKFVYGQYLVSCFSSKVIFLALEVKNYAKASTKAFWSCPISFNFLTFQIIFCRRLQVYLSFNFNILFLCLYVGIEEIVTFFKFQMILLLNLKKIF